MKKHILLLSIIMLLTTPSAYGEVKRVLIINSYHEGYHWTDRIMSGIKTVFDNEQNIELFINYMDTKRSSDQHHITQLKELYAHKYHLFKFDMIISTDDNALNFLLQYREELFPGVPVVFCGINSFKPEMLAGHSKYTGVSETHDIVGTVNLMHSIHPKVKNIYAISDNTKAEDYFKNHVVNSKEQINNKIKLHYLTNMSLPELRDTLQTLSKDALVLWALYLQTPDGNSISSRESVGFLSTASPVPMYCTWDVLGQGAVGGKITSPNFQGENAAIIALKILKGADIDAIPVTRSPVVTMFDFEQMERFNISEDNVPAGSIFLNRPYSQYEEYKFIIWITILFGIILLSIIIVLVYYIIKRRQAVVALIEAQMQLAHSGKMDAIGKLTGGIAHDFNNMLGAIIGSAEILETQIPNLDKTNIQLVNIILNAASQAADLTSKLLSFGHKGKMTTVPLDMQSIIDDTVAILQKTIDKKIAIQTLNLSDNSSVYGDKSSLQNTLINMGINAGHAISGAGTISITIKNIELDEAYCNASGFKVKPGRFLEIEFRDSGKGIKQSHLNKIFDPFFTTRKEGEGTGLGLAAVYGSIIDHHGIITVNSVIAKGTDFHMYLPVLKSKVTIEKSGISIVQGEGVVLLVDDEEVVRAMGIKLLESLGYEVQAAKGGEEAIDVYKKNREKIDLVITDLNMPKMSGTELFTQLKKINPECRVIISSGYVKDKSIEQLYKNGLNGFIKKPFKIPELSQLVRKIIKN